VAASVIPARWRASGEIHKKGKSRGREIQPPPVLRSPCHSPRRGARWREQESFRSESVAGAISVVNRQIGACRLNARLAGGRGLKA